MKFIIIYLTLYVLIKTSEQTARIVGGKNAVPKQFPFMVGVVVHADNFLCGGTVLNKKHVLTAAHCVYDEYDYVVKAGLEDIRYQDKNVQNISVQQKILHENYKSPTRLEPYDIAILKLASPLTYNDRVQPIHLTESTEMERGLVVLVGYGDKSWTVESYFPNILQYAIQQVVVYDECKRYFEGLLFKDLMICTGPLNNDTGVCYGDSGSPIVQYYNGVAVQIGLVAGIPFYPCGPRPVAFTRVSAFRDWIAKKIS